MMSPEIVKKNYRNAAGVKDSSDCWRTINGAHFTAWMSAPSDERIKEYRAAGIRCRRFGDELFVHHMDTDEALAIDRKYD